MTQHITTEEALRLGLQGADVYKYSHLLYHDDLNRDFGVVRLNLEALKAFQDTVTITHRKKLAKEHLALNRWFARGGIQTGRRFPWGKASNAQLEYVNYENLKIASGFELHLKARLLARNFVVHEISTKPSAYKPLAKEQEDRPILKTELMAVDSYRFDGQGNYLPGLKSSTLKFSLMTETPQYRSALSLSGQQLDIIDDYRQLRNQIHFPGDIVETPNISAYGGRISDFIVGFINSEIVDWSNELSAKYGFRFKTFDRLD